MLAEVNRPTGLLGEQVTLGLPLLGELGFQCPFQGAGHQPVLGFHRVVLATGTVGLEPGPFHRQSERTQAGGVGLLGIAQRLDGGVQCGWGKDGEHLGQDPLLQPAAAEALATLLAAIELPGAGTDIAGTVPLGAGVAGLHHPTAPAAPDPALQQR